MAMASGLAKAVISPAGLPGSVRVARRLRHLATGELANRPKVDEPPLGDGLRDPREALGVAVEIPHPESWEPRPPFNVDQNVLTHGNGSLTALTPGLGIGPSVDIVDAEGAGPPALQM